MADGICSFCGTFSRNKCDDREEASTCPNNNHRGAYHDFNARHVAEWIRYNANGDDDLEAAADLIEQKL